MQETTGIVDGAPAGDEDPAVDSALSETAAGDNCELQKSANLAVGQSFAHHSEAQHPAEGEEGAFAFNFASLQYADQHLEKMFVVFFHRGRNASIAVSITGTLVVAIFFVVQGVQPEPRYMIAFVVIAILGYAGCGWWLWFLKRDFETLSGAAWTTPHSRFRISGNSEANHKIRENAQSVDTTVTCLHLVNLFVTFAVYFAKSECFGLVGLERDETCANQFHLDGSVILLALVASIALPLRSLRFVAMQALMVIAFFAAHFVPTALEAGRRFLTFSMLLMATTTFMGVANAARHEITMRTQFEGFVRLCTKIDEIEAVKQRVQQSLRNELPEVWLRLAPISGDRFLWEDSIVVFLRLRNYGAWSATAGPKEALGLLARIDDVFQRVRRTIRKELQLLHHASAGDWWMMTAPIPATGTGGTVEAHGIPGAISPDETKMVTSSNDVMQECLRFLCASVCEASQVALAFQEELLKEKGATLNKHRLVTVDGAMDGGQCAVLPLHGSKSSTCKGPPVNAVWSSLLHLERCASSLGLAGTYTCAIGEFVAAALQVPFDSESTSCFPVEVPLVREDGTTERLEATLVRLRDLMKSREPPLSCSCPFRPVRPLETISIEHFRPLDETADGQARPADAPVESDRIAQWSDGGRSGSMTADGSHASSVTARLATHLEWGLLSVFTNTDTEEAYANTRLLATGTGDLAVCAYFFLGSSAMLLGTVSVFEPASFASANEGFPWAAGVFVLSCLMVAVSSLVHWGALPVPPRVVPVVTEATFCALFMKAVVSSWRPGFLAGGGSAWMFYLEFVLLARPLWFGPVRMWLMDAAMSLSFMALFLIGPSVPNPSVSTGVSTIAAAQAGILTLAGLFLRVVLEADRRSNFSIQLHVLLVKGELELQYHRLQLALEAFLPPGVAEELIHHQQRAHAHSAFDNVIQEEHQRRMRRRHGLATKVRDMILGSVSLQSAIAAGTHHSTSEEAYFASMVHADSICTDLLASFNALLTSARPVSLRRASLPPPIQLVKTCGDLMYFSIVDADICGVSETEGAAILAMFFILLRSALSREQALHVSMFISAGPLVGALFGADSPTFEFVGSSASSHAPLHRLQRELDPSGAHILVTERVHWHCDVHRRFGGQQNRSSLSGTQFFDVSVQHGSLLQFGVRRCLCVRDIGRVHVFPLCIPSNSSNVDFCEKPPTL